MFPERLQTLEKHPIQHTFIPEGRCLQNYGREHWMKTKEEIKSCRGRGRGKGRNGRCHW